MYFSYFQKQTKTKKMSIYPSLEDMKVDQMATVSEFNTFIPIIDSPRLGWRFVHELKSTADGVADFYVLGFVICINSRSNNNRETWLCPCPVVHDYMYTCVYLCTSYTMKCDSISWMLGCRFLFRDKQFNVLIQINVNLCHGLAWKFPFRFITLSLYRCYWYSAYSLQRSFAV